MIFFKIISRNNYLFNTLTQYFINSCYVNSYHCGKWWTDVKAKYKSVLSADKCNMSRRNKSVWSSTVKIIWNDWQNFQFFIWVNLGNNKWINLCKINISTISRKQPTKMTGCLKKTFNYWFLKNCQILSPNCLVFPCETLLEAKPSQTTQPGLH